MLTRRALRPPRLVSPHMPTESCKLESFPTHTYVQILPTLNESGWDIIEERGSQVITALGQRDTPACLVDLSELNYMGSSLVAFIVRIWKATKAGNGKLVLVCPNSGVREVIELAGLDKVWLIYDESDDALAALGVSHARMTTAASPWSIWVGAAAILLAIVATVLPLIAGVSPEVSMPVFWALSGLTVLSGLYTLVRSAGHQRAAGLMITVTGVVLLLLAGSGKLEELTSGHRPDVSKGSTDSASEDSESHGQEMSRPESQGASPLTVDESP